MNKKIVKDFITAINEHDVDAICSLMADDHKFIDAHGNVLTGSDKLKNGWIAYFLWFPDYKIEITDIFEKRSASLQSRGSGKVKGMMFSEFVRYDFIAVFGFASGTYKGIKTDDNKYYFRIPASWKANVEGRKIKLWQVYCDTKIPFEIINN